MHCTALCLMRSFLVLFPHPNGRLLILRGVVDLRLGTIMAQCPADTIQVHVGVRGRRRPAKEADTRNKKAQRYRGSWLVGEKPRRRKKSTLSINYQSWSSIFSPQTLIPNILLLNFQNLTNYLSTLVLSGFKGSFVFSR